jgi:hypothetical protein
MGFIGVSSAHGFDNVSGKDGEQLKFTSIQTMSAGGAPQWPTLNEATSKLHKMDLQPI